MNFSIFLSKFLLVFVISFGVLAMAEAMWGLVIQDFMAAFSLKWTLIISAGAALILGLLYGYLGRRRKGGEDTGL